MKRVLGFLAGLAWLVACVPGPASAQHMEKVAGWTIAGSRGLCLALGPVVDGESVSFAVGRGLFVLSFKSPRQRGDRTQTVGATLSIDENWRRRSANVSDFSEILIFEFDISDVLVEHLRNGQLLKIETGQTAFDVDLTGAAAAITALWECGRAFGELPPAT